MINSFKIRKQIKSGILPLIGSGSARMVYDLGNGAVVKVAKDKKGIIQNRTEVRISKKENKVKDPLNVFAVVYDYNTTCSIIIVEKCKEIENMHELQELINGKKTTTYFVLINKIHKKYKLLTGDMEKASSWGLNSKNKPVMIDYGCTYKMFYKYYA
jgi:hypothetical protein